MNAIERACVAAGGQVALARVVGVRPQAVSQWVTGSRPVPAKRCLASEEATGRQVTRYDLRPDVFGAAPTTDLREAG
jgi:DNA-binding transcriptional regulator YdaS (Cro superfamily)